MQASRGPHSWFRLPPDWPILRTQLGGQYGRPDLDVKFSGVVVGAMSVHRTGHIYQPNQRPVPAIRDLAELPRQIYDLLAAAGQPWAPMPTKRRRAAKPVSGRLQRGGAAGDVAAGNAREVSS